MSDDAKPARKSKRERLDDIWREAMERFDRVYDIAREERRLELQDRRLATIRGAWWEGQLAFGDTTLDANGEPEETGGPRMEVPKYQRAILRAIGDYRSSRKSVDFRPKGTDANQREANTLDGLYRADENDSPAGKTAYADNAFGEGILGGQGYWRLRSRWEDETDEENEHQRIELVPIYDGGQRVFFDSDAENYDKSDAKYGFVLTPYSREGFESKFPDHTPSTFADPIDWQYDWVRPERVMVAEYYVVEDASVERWTYRNVGTDEEQSEDAKTLQAEREGDVTLEQEWEQTGWVFERSRRVKRQRVHKYLLSGAECLKDEGYIAGPNIPIVPFYAERQYVDGIERTRGVVRPVIDSQRVYNLVVSKLAEASSGPSDDTPIVNPSQVQGKIADVWARRKIDHPAYLPLLPVLGDDGAIIQAGVSGSLPAAQVPQNVAALIQVAGADITALMGEQDRPQTVPANTSAQAIEIVNDEGDIAEYLWRDNLSLSFMRSGAIWLGMARELYVEERREMIALDEEGKQSVVTLAEPAMTEDGGQYHKNDLSSGAYDVIVDVGPATKTRRDATVKALVGVAQAAGSAGRNDWAAGALGVAIMNLEGEGIDAFSGWIRKQGLREGWVEPNEEEKQQMAAEAENAQPDPQQQLILAAAQQAVADAQKAAAQAIESQARAEKAKADTAAILASIDRDDRAQVLKAVEASTTVEQHEANMMGGGYDGLQG